MGHERKYGPEYPGTHHSGAPKPGLFGDIFEIEDIFYKSESECYKDRKKHSFFHGVYGGEGTCEYRKMFARLFYKGDDDIVKKYEFKGSKYHPSNTYPSVCERAIKDIELKKHKMKDGEKYSYKEYYEGVSEKSSEYFWDIHRKKSK